MSNRLVRTSKFLSYVLRHEPEALDLELEPGGWVKVSTLLERARNEGRALDRELLEQVIEHGEKKRFSLTEDGTKIRANYGHSIDVDLDLTPTPPPPTLFHGTATHALSSIRSEGLKPQSRQYVHLSSTPEEAKSVGGRHGSPVVLRVAAKQLHEEGFTLYKSTDAVWLTQRVPPRHLQFPEA